MPSGTPGGAELVTKYSDIRDMLKQAVGSTRDVELTNDVLDAVIQALPEVLAAEREHTRDVIADRLSALGNGRMDYVGKEPASQSDIMALTPLQAVVYGEAEGARWLSRIIRGEIDDKGWLPSWRWTT